MNEVLLTVSGVIPDNLHEDVRAAKRPEPDYLALARAFPADLLDVSAARKVSGRIGRLLERIGGINLLLAWACFCMRRQYRVIFSDGEQISIPLAILMKFAGGKHRPRHLMISHIISVPKKMVFFDLFRVHSRIDKIFVYSTWQKHFYESRWRIPEERVVFTPFMVNTDFFEPAQVSQPNPYAAEFADPMICTAGLEFRDYPTLLEAVREQDLRVVVAAASPWSKRSDTTAGREIPSNVTVRRFTQHELRDLYAASRFLVMPLYDVSFQAGVTALLEAMAMGKAVICSRTPGQTDVVVEGETGLYVPPGDPGAMREAIQYLLDHPDEAERMGQNGQRRIQDMMSLACYSERLNHHVQQALCGI
jgi:glycosyltransferase involved in cell wall biosynthesis